MNEPFKILIADDKESFRKSTADLLRREGFHCDSAPDSQSAREFLEADRYDLLVADIKMPGNENLEFINELQALDDRLPVIIVTAFPDVDTASMAVRLPVIAYLDKMKNQFDDLLEVVKTAAERKKMRQSMTKLGSQLADWSADLKELEKSFELSEDTSSGSVDTFIKLSMKNVISSLAGLTHLTTALANLSGQKEVCGLLNCPRAVRLTAGLRDTVNTLERTKKHFKSKELGELRQRIEALLSEEGVSLS